jgi:CubicO group peptidase (beta-lactamase class C family)
VTNAYETGGIAVHGGVDDGFGPVMDEFARNFRERGDLGAGCTAYVGGRTVVDIWAGTADRRTGRAYEHDTATVIFSCTKGVMAVCAYLLVQEGRLDLDAPIARYWPEFAQAGKEGRPAPPGSRTVIRYGLRCELRVRQQPDGRVRRPPGAVPRRGPADGAQWLRRLRRTRWPPSTRL